MRRFVTGPASHRRIATPDEWPFTGWFALIDQCLAQQRKELLFQPLEPIIQFSKKFTKVLLLLLGAGESLFLVLWGR